MIDSTIMERKVALITGITGQDGSFLAEFLLEKGYDVHGTIRRSSVDFRERIAHLEGQPKFHLHYADLGDSMSILQVVSKVRPTEIYNLAAQSHVQVSFDSPEFTADVDATGGESRLSISTTTSPEGDAKNLLFRRMNVPHGVTYGSKDVFAIRISSALRTCVVSALRFSLQVII